MNDPLIGTAGWTIPGSSADAFPAEGSSLHRYAARLRCAEINSSFHRPHRPSLYERWAAAVPDEFRFSVKLPKTLTHQQRLLDPGERLDSFLGEASGLGSKLALILVQLPPSLSFDLQVARSFFAALRARTSVRAVCEPRHPSWFEGDAEVLLKDLGVARVAADPARVPDAAQPGGWRGLSYYRLHGSPIIYRSSYDPERLRAYADDLRKDLEEGREAWCIFDNTASSAAAGNALALQQILAG